MSTLQSGVIRVIACVAGGIGGGAREPREVGEHVKSKLSLQLSLRKQPTFRNATTGFPAKWRLRNERRNVFKSQVICRILEPSLRNLCQEQHW